MKSIKQLEILLTDQRFSHFFKIALAVCIVVICLLAFSPIEESVGEYSNDKVNHLIAFLTLAFLMDFSYPKPSLFKLKMLAILSFASFIEVVQYFIPFRTFSLIDIVADMVGVLFYLVLKRRVIAVRSLT